MLIFQYTNICADAPRCSQGCNSMAPKKETTRPGAAPFLSRRRRMQAEVFKAMAHPFRVAVVEFLGQGARCVCEIARHLGETQPNVSRHLALMVRAGVLDSRKEGLKVYYRLRTPCVMNFLRCVDGVLRARLRATEAALRRPAMTGSA